MPTFPYWRLSGYYFFYFAFIGVFLPYFGLYLQSLSFSAWDIGVLMSQMQLMRLFGPYAWSVIADRCGERIRVIRLTGIVTLLVFSLFFFSTRFDVLFVAIALLSFFWVAALPLLETLIFDHLRENAARYSRVRLWGSIGFVVAVLGAGAALDHLPIKSVLWFIVIALAATQMLALFVPEAPPFAPHGEQVAIGDVLRQSRVRALLFASFAMSAAHGALNIFYSIFLADHGYSKSLVGGLWSLGVIAEIAVFYFMARIMRRFSLRSLLLACFAAAIVRFVMIGYGVASLPTIVAAQVLHGLTFGAFHSTAITAINRWFPGRTRSRGQALYSSVGFGAGGLAGGLASAWAWDHLGGALTFATGSLYALAGWLVVAKWVRERADEKPDRPAAAIS